MKNTAESTKSQERLGGIILIIFLGIFVASGWWIINAASKLTVIEVTPLLTVIIPVFGAFVTAAGALIAVLRSKTADRQREIDQELREKKGPIYEEFTQFLIGKVLRNNASHEEMMEYIVKFSQEMIVWGDDEVIHAWANFKSAAETAEIDPRRSLFATEDILFAIRRSMGHFNKTLRRGDLLSLFVNDIHTILTPSTDTLKINDK